MSLSITEDDPQASDVAALIRTHLDFSSDASPPEDRYALDPEGLTDPAITFFSARTGDELLAVGAIKMLGDGQAELKSMHTTAAARGQGIGQAMLLHLLSVAREGGLERVNLETGSMEAFAPARALYEKFGFSECRPYGNYRASINSTYMTLDLVNSGLTHD